MKIRLFTLVYGNEFLDLFERVAARSLLQAKNKTALNGCVVSLYTDAETSGHAHMVATQLGSVDVHEIVADWTDARTQQRCMLAEVRRCLDDDAAMVICNPENYFGDGAFSNLIRIGSGCRGICVASAFPRVNRQEFLEKLPPWDVDCPTLVGLAIETLHPSWQAAWAGRAISSSYDAGITIDKLSDKLYAVNHLLPTIFMAQFVEDDYTALGQLIDAGVDGVWDHYWPELVVAQNRQRTIGSSDAFFVTELTDPNTHNVQLMRHYSDNRYHRDGLHIRSNRNVVSIWRAA